MRKKRILLLSEGFGSGHTQAAHAISVGLRRHSPSVRTRVLELGAFQHPTIAPWIFSAYRKTITSNPKLFGKIYKSKYKKELNRFTSMALHRIFYNATDEIIEQLQPDMIVCTHMFPSIVVSRLKRAGLRVPLVTVITDYDAHGTWVGSEVDHYLVSTPEVKDKLMNKGVPADIISVTGMPVHPDFWKPMDREPLLGEFGLADMPTVLFMGGGWGLIKEDELIFRASQFRDRVQMIFCLGNNEKLKEQLSEDPRLMHPNIKLLGYTKEIDKLMDVSDLLVTKPGGMTCSEGLAKGIPMLFYNPIPGQEEENAQYFIDNGYGVLIESPDDIDAWFGKLIREHQSFLAKRKAQRDNRRNTTNPDVCSEVILSLLDGQYIQHQPVTE
ncbi:MGDG synthase family glycosyltransferase [Gorillibacterium sp. sgz500922]|uniref:MGDG synthase family glycosyltransferase n=1 Tax=Gorillibacterium sp. sgz500922 TaxID=3446694 RepID=UPI003F666E3B